MNLMGINIPPFNVGKTNISRDKEILGLCRNQNQIFNRYASSSREDINLKTSSSYFRNIVKKKLNKEKLSIKEEQIFIRVKCNRRQQLISLNRPEDLKNLSEIYGFQSTEPNPLELDRDFLEEIFGDSNRKISERYNLGLEKYNYVGF